MSLTDRDNFMWLVGLLEGEGSFLRPSPSKPKEPKVDVEMKDHDVLRRVAALCGVAYRLRDRHRPNVNVTYHVRISGKRAVSLMWRMRPYMSERRRVQIDRAVQCYVDRGIAFHPGNLPPYEFQPICGYSLCPERRLEHSTRCAGHQVGIGVPEEPNYLLLQAA